MTGAKGHLSLSKALARQKKRNQPDATVGDRYLPQTPHSALVVASLNTKRGAGVPLKKQCATSATGKATIVRNVSPKLWQLGPMN